MQGDESKRIWCNIDQRRLSILLFSLIFAWVLTIPFEGQVLYALAQKNNIDPHSMIFGAIAAHFFGLFCCGLIIKTILEAKRLIQIAIIICILSTTVFFFPPGIGWNIALIVSAFVAGMCVAAWGFYFKSSTPANERIKTAADVLIYSNILMIIMNLTAIYLSPFAGLAASILVLGAALFFTFRLKSQSAQTESGGGKEISVIKPLAFLCLFIVVVTINSGLMYQVMNPAFAHHQWLVSWYWAVPYIIALYIMKKLPRKTNRTYILYVAIAMIGFAFISFMTLDRSASSYLLVNTMMLGACGVYDLFWWSILGEMLDFTRNPARILGVGLSANVLGVLLGGLAGNAILTSGIPSYNPSVLALIVVFVILIILPPLHKYLSLLLKNHSFLTMISEMTGDEQDEAAENILLKGQLTHREGEIASLLLKGRTYKAVASELYLSENTVKTHIKNIYSKLNIRSRMELVNLIIDSESLPK